MRALKEGGRAYFVCIAESVSTDANLNQISCVYPHLVEVTTTRRHRLIPDHCLECVAVAYSDSDWAHVLINELLFLLFNLSR